MRVRAAILGACQVGNIDLCRNMERKNKMISVNFTSLGQNTVLWQKNNETLTKLMSASKKINVVELKQ